MGSNICIIYNVHVHRQTSNRLVLCSRICYKLINLVHISYEYVTQLSISTNGVLDPWFCCFYGAHIFTYNDLLLFVISFTHNPCGPIGPIA
jgi:hypothetical protein